MGLGSECGGELEVGRAVREAGNTCVAWTSREPWQPGGEAGLGEEQLRVGQRGQGCSESGCGDKPLETGALQ